MTSNTPSKPVIAAFDFDGTITYKDSLLPFLFLSSGKIKGLINLFLELPIFLLYILKLANRQQVKEKLLTRFLKGKSALEIETLAKKYADTTLKKLVKEEGLKKIAWHLSKKHRCIIVSANLEPYLRAWGFSHGFSDVIASKLNYENDLFTGKLLGTNCRGKEKVCRLKELLGPLTDYEIYAYGDSAGDKEMLEIADHPFYRAF